MNGNSLMDEWGNPLPQPVDEWALVPRETGALQSLYGKGNAKRRKANTSKALQGAGEEREQTVLTPPWLLRALVESVGLPIALDPATTAENPTGALLGLDGSSPGRDGLAAPWGAACAALGGFCYVNPPFNDLESWLPKAALEGDPSAPEGAWVVGCPLWFLGPFRCHRPWFGPPLRRAQVWSLKSFPFVGQKSAIPFPLFLAGWNVPVLRSLKDNRGREHLLGRWRFE